MPISVGSVIQLLLCTDCHNFRENSAIHMPELSQFRENGAIVQKANTQ